MKGLSLFAGAGIGETFLADCGIDIITSNELVPKRAALYKATKPSCNVICGDIRDVNVFNKVMLSSKNIDFLIASPPCQGMSIAGKNRCQNTMIEDKRNYLVNYVFDSIAILKPKYILIENVPALLKIKLPFNGKLLSIMEILSSLFGKDYQIDSKVVDS